MSLRQNILNRRPTASRIVSPSFLKGTATPHVELRSITVGERDAALEGSKINETRNNTRFCAILLITMAYVPATEEKVFDVADLETLLAMDAQEFDELADPALELIGLNQKKVDAAEKN